MSRLDRHVSFVQGKLALGKFFYALALTVSIWLVAVWVGVLGDRLAQLRVPRPFVVLGVSAGVAVVLAFIYSLVRKPTPQEAAVAIDQALGLNEKFSTALYARGNKDPFAVASVMDAERAAENVSLHRQFPLSFPRRGYWTVGIAVAVLLTSMMVPSVDLLGREAKRKQAAADEQKRAEAKKVVERAIATVNSYPKSLQSDQAIQMARKDLEGLLNQPVADPDRVSRTAFKALEQSNEAVKEEIRRNDQFATAHDNEKMLKSLNPPADEQGPVADAQRQLAKGDLSKAVDTLSQIANKFDKMSDAEQKKAADQMAKMAQQLQQMAQNPAAQQQLQKQLQQMTGMSPQQAQQLAKQMQQAAQGNQQAQQQLKQMQQQLMQQAQKQGMSQQAQQQMQQAMQQMQAQANSQASAQQMQQAAQQMAQAMKQSAGQKGGQQGGMAKAQQQMQQAVGQMDAVQKDAEQMAAAQQSTDQAQSDAADQASDKPGGDQNGKDPGYSDKTGKWQPGEAGKNGQGAGGPGKGNGGHVGVEQAPYAIKKETAPVQDIDSGKILASTFVKAGTVKGDSKVALSKAAESAMKDSTDEVDEESVSKDSQKYVKSYFETMQQGQ